MSDLVGNHLVSHAKAEIYMYVTHSRYSTFLNSDESKDRRVHDVYNAANFPLHFGCIARQMGHCMGGNFNIHIWAWSASPSVQVGR